MGDNGVMLRVTFGGTSRFHQGPARFESGIPGTDAQDEGAGEARRGAPEDLAVSFPPLVTGVCGACVGGRRCPRTPGPASSGFHLLTGTRRPDSPFLQPLGDLFLESLAPGLVVFAAFE